MKKLFSFKNREKSFFNDIASVFYLFKLYLRKHMWLLFVLVFFNAATGLLHALQPLTIAPAVNAVMGSYVEPAGSITEISLDNIGPTILSWFGVYEYKLGDIIWIVAVMYLSLTIFIAILDSIAFWMSARIRGRVLNDMLVSLHNHTISLPISFFNDKKEGDLISRFTTDASATTNVLDGLFRGLLQALIQILVFMVLLVKTDILLVVATVIVGSSHMIVTRTLSGWLRKRTKLVYDFYGKFTTALQESIQNARVIKSFAAEKFDRKRYRSAVDYVEINLFKYRIVRFAETPIRLLTDALSVVFMMFLAYYAMNNGRITASGFGMFVFLAGRAIAPISAFSQHFLSIFVVAGSADRILEILAIKNKLINGSVESPAMSKAIRLENVSFSYKKDTGKVLNDVDVEFSCGEMTAIVGPSGSGKSTLCDLILRLHDPSQGSVLMDDIDIRDLNSESYLRQFGVVPQESHLLNTSVRENVLFGRKHDKAMFEKALKMAHADRFINELPDGVETEIGDQGVRLSGGQRQRLAIARAVYGNPSILVLDEATSSLDTESERAVQMAIDGIVKEMTAIVVAHRLSTVMHADRIIVMKDGNVDSIGRHDELIQTCDTYQRLHSLQFSKNH